MFFTFFDAELLHNTLWTRLFIAQKFRKQLFLYVLLFCVKSVSE